MTESHRMRMHEEPAECDTSGHYYPTFYEAWDGSDVRDGNDHLRKGKLPFLSAKRWTIKMLWFGSV